MNLSSGEDQKTAERKHGGATTGSEFPRSCSCTPLKNARSSENVTKDDDGGHNNENDGEEGDKENYLFRKQMAIDLYCKHMIVIL